MANLPLLPGYTFQDITVKDYKLPHKLDVLNGFPVVRDTNYGIGRRLTDVASIRYAEGLNPVECDISSIYGPVPCYVYRQFVPHYAVFAQKCLCFKAFFRQGVFNSPDEHYRVRHVDIIYYLEDDTLCVIEPVVKNAGFRQGKLVRRNKIPKNVKGDLFIWKDFNVGIDVCIYGVVYHIVDCDLFTREFLTSQGIDVGEKENLPADPYTEWRDAMCRTPTGITRVVSDDSRRRFLEYDGMVLTFDATWSGDRYRVMYFLTDDTVAIREIHELNDGKDPVVMLLKRMRVPKNWRNLPSWHPSIYMEYGDPEIVEYYTPRDFRVGETIVLFGRCFLLYNCDAFTRKYYSDMLGTPQPDAIPIPTKMERPAPKYEIPPHIQFGSPEDTYASCLSFIPKPPKKNVIRQLTNFPKKLRYSARMDAIHPEDEGRDFVLEYSLSNGTIQIIEIEKPNSGRREGCFLSSRLIPKPYTGNDNPEYYTPQDFFIGARINVFNHRFIITGTDLFVYRYVDANRDKFSQKVLENLRNYFLHQGMLQDDMDAEVKKIQMLEDEQKLFATNVAAKNIEDDISTGKCMNKEFDMTGCKELTTA
ncbi:EF-hand domain-containing protein 1 [Trachymyrmex septentrionalis]|uniref:EF-hand domain-containing protein 1 n=1 Tax=Trachymyrmex septentrionalis TaxID=34720 RepID=A0A195FK62_9HYME|nr:PREDICTED: EF-hand domain-containing protein 1-like [Trachymyrmex septentrionalis]KYN40389.1 EF-hand domain-containing protein 1 [Trachymyrmex septentrionalis]